MKRKLIFAMMLIIMLAVGPVVSRAAQADNQSTAPANATNKRVKKNKVKRVAMDVEKGTKATGKAIAKGAEKTGKGTARVARKVGSAFKSPKQTKAQP